MQVDITTSTQRGLALSGNIIATTKQGRTDRKVVVGYAAFESDAPSVFSLDQHDKLCSTCQADLSLSCSSHLDSVPFGPGINDNGSGSSLNLELALQLHRRGTRVENQVLLVFCSDSLGVVVS